MKVLFDVSTLGLAHYSPNLKTGIFRVVENLAGGLYASPDCNTIFCASLCNHGNCRLYLDRQKELEGYRLSQPGNFLSSLYDLMEPLRFRMSVLNQRGWKVPLKNFYQIGKNNADPIDRKELSAADIFHTPFLAIPEQIIRDRKVKKFITIHDLIPFIFPEYCSPLTVDHMKSIFSSIKSDTFVICVSEATRQDFLAHVPRFDPAMSSVVPLAASSHFYFCSEGSRIQETRKKYGIPDGSRYFLALSTLSPHKNFERIIKSFIRLLKQERAGDLYLVIAGAGGLSRQSVYQEIENSDHLAGRIILTGYLPEEDLSPLYSGALAFLFPSLYEGFGLPPLEAMKCGAPVITSNSSSLPEVVGEAAIKIDPRDEDALSQAMLDLYNHEDLREKYSRFSLERAKLFSWEKTIEGHLAAYQKALHR